VKFVKIFISTIIVGLILFGCSKDIQYKTLTFFFDGVPDNYIASGKKDTLLLVDTSKQQVSLLKAPETNRFIHPPYGEKGCSNCHVDGGFTMPQPKLCYQCHDDFAKKYTYLHGPVAGGYCTSCHHPHMGEKKLLLRKGQDLCLYCHEKELVFKNENHSGIEDTKCTECHNPHGGNDKTLLN
jgi:predicted CXXCH cytochrome family protein